MAFFNYKAKNEHAETVKGKVEAKTVAQAVAALRSRGLLVIDLKQDSGGIFSSLSTSLQAVNKDDVVGFTRQLSTMITAGLALTEALSILEEQAKPAMAQLLDGLLREVEGGKSFAQALSKHPKVFSEVYVQLVRAGETAGVLDTMMARLAENMEKNKEFRSKTQGALIYPAIVVTALVVVAVVMMIFVIPKLTEMYQDFGADLPASTQALISLSDFFTNNWWVMLALLIGAAIGIRTWWQTPAGKRRIAEYVFRIPLYGDLRKKVILTEFARTLSLLLTAGISLLQALDIARATVSSVLYQGELDNSIKQVEKGVGLARTVENSKLFPPILTQMIRVGEETGQLDEVLRKISDYFQSESEQAVKNLTTAIEPTIMIVLGVGVALMVVAIIMPIYNLTSQF